MYQVKYIKWGSWLVLITMTSYTDALKIKESKEKQCGGMWAVVQISPVNSYDDAIAMIGDFDPYDGAGKK